MRQKKISFAAFLYKIHFLCNKLLFLKGGKTKRVNMWSA